MQDGAEGISRASPELGPMTVNMLNRRRVAPKNLFGAESQSAGDALTLLRTGRIAAVDDCHQDLAIQAGGLQQLFQTHIPFAHPFGQAFDGVHAFDLSQKCATVADCTASLWRLATPAFGKGSWLTEKANETLGMIK